MKLMSLNKIYYGNDYADYRHKLCIVSCETKHRLCHDTIFHDM